ncbi:MAG: Mce-associated rane protein, partial [Acidimicrobiaceae bacterium]|nr:Mce-associated rane protein [Acidimicrobiaceae bacterium]
MIPGRPLAEPDRVPDAAAGTAEPLVADEPSPAADAEAPPEGSDEAAPAATARRGRLTLVLVAVLVVIAVVATTLAGVFYGRYRDDRAQRREVVNVSSAMVTALTTYDYTNLDASRKQVLALATGRFKQEYDKGSEPLRLVLTQTQARSTGTVRKVYVGDVADGSA